jgi:hypothetical protein
LVAGRGTNTLTFTMPGTVALNVQSVVATIDNTAGAATAGEVVIRDQSGVVIATKRQGDTIPAADTGTATWALRLVDEGGGIDFDKLNVGGWLDVHTTGQGGSGNGGITFNVDSGEFEVHVNDAVFGTFRVVAPFVFYDVGGGIFRLLNCSLVELNADQFTAITTAGASMQTANATVGITAAEEVSITLANNQPLTVFDNGGNPIFRVDEDGDLHGLTGKALTFDL